MTFTAFIAQFDKPGVVVLLEGKREVKEADQQKLIDLGNMLCKGSQHMLFRSGNAPGADCCFSKGVAQVNAQRLQVITPYNGHRQAANVAHSTISLEDINLVEEPEVVYQSKSNKKTENLISPFVDGTRNPITIKAAYIIRDTIKVIGTSSGVPPCNVALFYDDLETPRTGGTGHTMKICEANAIPFYDQRVWMEWFG